jgi:predicted aspartyl protease
MLSLGSEIFTIGRLSFFDQAPESDEQAAKLYIPFRIGGMNFSAQLDTGAPWTILNADIAEAFDLFNGTGQQVPISTRLGRITGRLERINITLVAVEGASLDVDATVFVSRDWTEQSFIGWSGFLERVRFAIDPSRSRQHFYFGPAVV